MSRCQISSYTWDKGAPTARDGVKIKTRYAYIFIDTEDIADLTNRLIDWLETHEGEA